MRAAIRTFLEVVAAAGRMNERLRALELVTGELISRVDTTLSELRQRDSRVQRLAAFVTVDSGGMLLGSSVAWLSPGDDVTFIVDPMLPLYPGARVEVPYPFVLDGVYVGAVLQQGTSNLACRRLALSDAVYVGSRLRCRVSWPKEEG